MHGFYEDDKDSKPDMLLTKTGLYSKADIYLNGKDSNLSVDAWLIPIDQDHLTSPEQVDVSRYSNKTDIVEYMNCKTNKKRWLDMISSRDLVFAGMRLASKRTADGNIEVHLYSDHTGMFNPYGNIDVPDLYVPACLGEVEQNGKVISKFSWGVWDDNKDDGSYTTTLLLDSNGIEAYKKYQAQFKEAIEEYKSYGFSISEDLSANMPVKKAKYATIMNKDLVFAGKRLASKKDS